MTRRVTRPTLTLLMILALLPPLAGAGPLAQEIAEIIVFERCHGETPANRRFTLGAI